MVVIAAVIIGFDAHVTMDQNDFLSSNKVLSLKSTVALAQISKHYTCSAKASCQDWLGRTGSVECEGTQSCCRGKGWVDCDGEVSECVNVASCEQ